MSVAPTPVEHFAALAKKVDGLFSATFARYGDVMQCAAGCADCCQAGLSVTSVEAAVIRAGLDSLEPEARAAVAARARAADGSGCAALDDQGRCGIYQWRPLVCRSHGVPVRVAPQEPGHLPVVEVCPKNFTDGLADVDEGSFLDQGTLSTVLGAIDAAYADQAGIDRGTRVAIVDVLCDAQETEHE